jgi:uncharacterized protein
MPVRSSSSRVLRWPDAEAVRGALADWARALRDREPELRAVACFGSYARGDWGPGSDLDVIVILAHDETPPLERARRFDMSALPVPSDLLVYTEAEFNELIGSGTRFARMLETEMRQVWP